MTTPRRLIASSLAIAACSGSLANTETTPPTAAPAAQSGRAQVNGIRIYYEIHGQGEGPPLVLLPGGGSDIEVTYGRILPFLARHRRVIALDEQNHGRSDHRQIPERFTDSADDAAAVLAQLGVQKADIMGFSNGGSVAMQVAIRHPQLVRKLIFSGSMTKSSGAPPQFWQAMQGGSFADMPQPLKDAFLKINPDPAALHDMYEKDAERMRNFVDTSDDDVKAIEIPVLIILGDRDVPTTEHAVELTRLMPQARLLILPGGHGEFLGELLHDKQGSRYPEISSRLIEDFLNTKE